MKLDDKEVQLWLNSLAKSDTAGFLAFDKENRMLGNSIAMFCTMRLADTYPRADSRNTRWVWNEAIRAICLLPSVALFSFAYAGGSNREMNLLMLQTLIIDRKVEPIMQGRILAMGMCHSKIGDTLLHRLWFLKRWEEWKGDGNWEEMIGPQRTVPGEEWYEEGASPQERWDEAIRSIRVEDAAADLDTAHTILKIRARIERAQAQDFEVDGAAIDWWRPEEAIPVGFVDEAYWPLVELEDVLRNIDPQERRRLIACVKSLKGIDLPPFFGSMEAFDSGPGTRIRAEKGEDAYETYFGDVIEYVGIYMHFRSFLNDHPSQNLLWYIFNLQHCLDIGADALAVRFWRESHKALDAHVAPIWGLWLLDLGRRLLHQGEMASTFGQEMEWIHEKELKLLAKLERGNYTTES